MDMREAVKIYKKGYGHFFDKETMRFWESRIESELFTNRCFVTSENNFNDTARFYTVRRFSEEYTKVETIGEFNKIVDYAEAVKFAMDYKEE